MDRQATVSGDSPLFGLFGYTVIQEAAVLVVTFEKKTALGVVSDACVGIEGKQLFAPCVEISTFVSHRVVDRVIIGVRGIEIAIDILVRHDQRGRFVLAEIVIAVLGKDHAVVHKLIQRVAVRAEIVYRVEGMIVNAVINDDITGIIFHAGVGGRVHINDLFSFSVDENGVSRNGRINEEIIRDRGNVRIDQGKVRKQFALKLALIGERNPCSRAQRSVFYITDGRDVFVFFRRFRFACGRYCSARCIGREGLCFR